MNLSYTNNYSNEETTRYGFHTETGKGSIMAEHLKNQLHPSLLFWDIAKILQTCYFEYFEDAWLRPAKMIITSL